MLIAFEGPDNLGKTYAAEKLSGGNVINYVEPESYKFAQQTEATEKGLVQCFDGVSWISHAAYHLAMPRTHCGDPAQIVFPMPDTHLVFKVHEGDQVALARINTTYVHQAKHLMALNEALEYSLFKTISIIGVSAVDVHSGLRKQAILEFSSPLHPWFGSTSTRLVTDDMSLLDLLMVEEARR